MKILKFVILTPLLWGSFFSAMAQDSDSAFIENNSCFENTFPLINTFLGNWERNYYGKDAPDALGLVWKHFLGKGETVISRKSGSREWAGAGWTGQPLLVNENGRLFLIQGAYDHHLKKIEAETDGDTDGQQ
mgnify:FL=1